MSVLFDNIGGYDCVQLIGDLAPEGELVEEITRKGVDGRAWRQLSQKGATTQLSGLIDCDGIVDADETMSGLMSLQGTVVSIILYRAGTSLEYDNFLIETMGGFRRVTVGSPVGGTSAGNVILTFSCTVSYAGSD